MMKSLVLPLSIGIVVTCFMSLSYAGEVRHQKLNSETEANNIYYGMRSSGGIPLNEAWLRRYKDVLPPGFDYEKHRVNGKIAVMGFSCVPNSDSNSRCSVRTRERDGKVYARLEYISSNLYYRVFDMWLPKEALAQKNEAPKRVVPTPKPAPQPPMISNAEVKSTPAPTPCKNCGVKAKNSEVQAVELKDASKKMIEKASEGGNSCQEAEYLHDYEAKSENIKSVIISHKLLVDKTSCQIRLDYEVKDCGGPNVPIFQKLSALGELCNKEPFRTACKKDPNCDGRECDHQPLIKKFYEKCDPWKKLNRAQRQQEIRKNIESAKKVVLGRIREYLKDAPNLSKPDHHIFNGIEAEDLPIITDKIFNSNILFGVVMTETKSHLSPIQINYTMCQRRKNSRDNSAYTSWQVNQITMDQLWYKVPQNAWENMKSEEKAGYHDNGIWRFYKNDSRFADGNSKQMHEMMGTDPELQFEIGLHVVLSKYISEKNKGHSAKRISREVLKSYYGTDSSVENAAYANRVIMHGGAKPKGNEYDDED